MSSTPKAVSELRKGIQEQRAMLFLIGDLAKVEESEPGEYVFYEIDPNDYHYLWDLWRSRLPQAPPEEPPPVRTRAEGQRALDALGRRLDDLFGPVSPGETKELCQGLAAAVAAGSRRPMYDRDHTWLRWSEKETLTPAKIRDRWNKEHPEAKIGTGESGRDVVKKGLAAARRDAK